MENQRQDWGKAYQQIATLITTKVPKIKHVDLYYGQEQFIDGDGNWIPFQCPAVFLDILFTTTDLGEGRQLIDAQVVVRLAVETVQDTNMGSLGQARAMEFIGIMREIHEALHNSEGDDFGPMNRVGMQRHEAPPQMYMWSQTYATTLLDYGSTRNYDELNGIPLQILPRGGPDTEVGDLVLVHNSDDTYSVELAPGTTHLLPDVTHTDSDGAPAVRPAMTPFIATLCGVALPARIRTSDGTTLVMTAPSDSDTPLPLSTVVYEKADGSGILLHTGQDTILIGGELAPGHVVNRFVVTGSNGVTPYATADMLAPTVIVPLQPVKNSLGSTVSSHEIGQDGLAPNALVKGSDISAPGTFAAVSGATTPMPKGQFAYKDANTGTILYLGGDNSIETQVAAGYVFMTQVAERFTVTKSNGLTVYARRDVVNNTLVLPLQPVKNSAGAPVSSHEVGEDGLAPDVNIRNKLVAPTLSINVPAGTIQVIPQVRVVRRDGSTVDYDYEATPIPIHTEAPDTVLPNVLHQYTAGATWNKPSSPKFKGIWVLAVGGGGSGGTGRNTVTTRSAGSGAGGGCIVLQWIPAASLSSSHTITIGSGGAVVTGNAQPGLTGGDTSFGSLVNAKGGTGGQTPLSIPTDTGLNSGCTPARGPWAVSGGLRGVISTGNGANGFDGLSNNGAPSGGGGGGKQAGNSNGTGGNGGGVYNAGSLVAGPTGGAIASPGGNGGNGVNNAALLTILDVAATIGIGTAGAGGGSVLDSNTTAAGNGGNGGLYGAGGGGGGSSNGLAATGNGGAGAQGCMLVLDVY